jgi:hypothetical protein
MPFVFAKIFEHGTTDPVVARLMLQTHDLVKHTRFNEPTHTAIFEAAFDAASRLIRCGDIRAKLVEECKKQEQGHHPGNNPKTANIPHVIGLKHEAETFLYEAKNFLRDLTPILNAAFGTTFKNAGDFAPPKKGGESPVCRWASEQFGPTAKLVEMVRAHQGWMGNLIGMRNAVEHPGGSDGTLHISNYEPLSDGRIERPGWRRDGEPARLLIDDMTNLCDALLIFAESLIVLIVVDHLISPLMQVYAIPEGRRNPDCPQAFIVNLSEAATRKLQERSSASGAPQRPAEMP